MHKDNDIPAFPRSGTSVYGWQQGMTLRDYIAIEAMHLAAVEDKLRSHEEVATEAYNYADAMLKERDK